MPCIHVGNAIICTRGGRRLPKCRWCSCQSTKLCDFPLTGEEAGKTCDAPICDVHATSVGSNRDYCPPHTRYAEALKQGI
jgi:hypothetical protein